MTEQGGSKVRVFLPILLTLAGAILGGGFPGSLVAFFFAVATGVSGSQGEAICLAANLVLGVVGASSGMLAGKTIQRASFRRFDVVLPLVLGLVVGMVGYLWLDWAISHADPPL